MDQNALKHKQDRRKERDERHTSIAIMVDLALDAIAERVALGAPPPLTGVVTEAPDARRARHKLVEFIQQMDDHDTGFIPDKPEQPADSV